MFKKLSWFNNLSLRVKFTIFMAIIIVQAAATVLYLRHQISVNYDATLYQQEQSDALSTITSINRNFERMVYWLTEMTVSLSDESEGKATAHKEKIIEELAVLETFNAKLAEHVEQKLPEVENQYWDGLDAYFDEDREAGAELMAIARQSSDDISAMLMEAMHNAYQNVHDVGESVKTQSSRAATLAGILLVILVVCGVLITVILINIIVKPVKRVTEVMERLSNDDFDVEIKIDGRRDEIGQMLKAVEVFKVNGLMAKELEVQKAEENKAKQKRAEYIQALTEDFDSQVKEISSALNDQAGQAQSTVNSMVDLAQVTSTQFASANESCKQADENVQQVASTVDEFTSSIREISEQVQQSNKLTTEAVDRARTANGNVENLQSDADKIGDVIGLINDIAEKTNLLALNATIEAARAGDAGKGFAVVANEVKDLAAQTAEATQEVSELVQSIQSNTGETVVAMQHVTEKIEQINQSASVIAAAVEEQNVTVQGVSSNAQQTASLNTKVIEGLESVSESSRQTEDASQSVLEAIMMISERQGDLNMLINSFLTDVKSV